MAKLKEIAERFKFDENALMEFLRGKLHLPCKTWKVLQYEGGQSNPTYLITIDNEHFVLRRKPPGVLLPSAHQIEREYRVMSALKNTDVPVPEMLVLCEEATVIGTAFFLMKHIEGRVFDLPTADSVSTSERRKLFEEMTRVLTLLHRVDYDAIGLSDFGKKEDYVARQVARWSKQYLASRTEEIPQMQALMQYLPLHVPASSFSSIVHGDYRLGNLMFHPQKAEVVAVLDWEISTLGDPNSDLAYNCLDYYLPSPGGFSDLAIADLGIPTQAERFAYYFKLMGREPLSERDWQYYVAFNLFRMAAIIQGVYARALQGNASSSTGITFGPMVSHFATQATRLLKI